MDEGQQEFPTDDFLARMRENAARLQGLYEEQKKHLAFARSLDECVANESYITTQLRSEYKNRLGHIHFLSLKYFDDFSQFIRYQDVPRAYFLNDPTDASFVSHYWHTPQHPDPDGVDFSILKERFSKAHFGPRESVGLWYDFSCVPQRGLDGDRTDHETEVFNSTLKVIHLLPMLWPAIVMHRSGYLDRSWCCCEWLFATTISPVLVEPGIFPFGNAVKFRHLALIVLFLTFPEDFKKQIIEGRDGLVIPFINSLVKTMFSSTESTYASDKTLLQGMLHRHLWYHLRMYGIRSQMMIGFLLLAQCPATFVNSLFQQFLFLSGDPDMIWTGHALIDLDLMALIDADDFDTAIFHKLKLQTNSGSYIRERTMGE